MNNNKTLCNQNTDKLTQMESKLIAGVNDKLAEQTSNLVDYIDSKTREMIVIAETID